MVVSAEGIKVGDELIGKCIYTSLVHFDGLYYVNTNLYPKNKGGIYQVGEDGVNIVELPINGGMPKIEYLRKALKV